MCVQSNNKYSCSAFYYALKARWRQYRSKFKFEFTAEERLVCSAVCFSVLCKTWIVFYILINKIKKVSSNSTLGRFQDFAQLCKEVCIWRVTWPTKLPLKGGNFRVDFWPIYERTYPNIWNALTFYHVFFPQGKGFQLVIVLIKF